MTVVESGFAALPADIREDLLRANTEGWIAQTTHLLDYLVGEQARQ